MFFAPKFFLGERPLEFLEWDYKIQLDSDHVAKFQGDRSRELENEWRNKKRLEVHGRARREAARRRKSECQINFRKTKFLSQ